MTSSGTSGAAEPLPNPFDEVSDDDLYQMQVSLSYGCLRSRAGLQPQHKKHVCALLAILQEQASARPSKSPHFPYPPPA